MHCHETSTITYQAGQGSVALVGHPNVGKSAIFQRLTGQRVTISNYPGTTVEITRGRFSLLPQVSLLDTPGVITFPPFSEDEQVTARVLLYEPLQAILQVGDAKNLRRTLLLSLQLAEMGLPLVVALNMVDEAAARGIRLDTEALSNRLDLSFVVTSATQGRGISQLVDALQGAATPAFKLDYPLPVEEAVAALETLLPAAPISRRALALSWLSQDPITTTWLAERLSPVELQAMQAVRSRLQDVLASSLPALIQQTRQALAEQLAIQFSSERKPPGLNHRGVLSSLTTHPVWGVLILVGVLYLLYWFVGMFGAGTLVGLLEEDLFSKLLNPRITTWVEEIAPFPILAEFLVGKYGLWTMGITYALALILPIVTTFFLAFGIMEDSGYLPRLAALSNRLFSVLGLNGKAVLPMVLGLGCVTMATLTARVMESKRERLLVTLLLALAVPCSAQLGVVMGMLAGISLTAVLIWSGIVILVLLVVGWLAARLVPGERTPLLVELPPLRLPQASNVILKTLTRLEWYLKEVLPLFLLGAALLFTLDQLGLLDRLIRAGEPLVTGWLGLPAEASAAFLMGFLRRDFGATGLFLMQSQGLLNAVQVIVAMVTITLLIPCIASVMMIARERGVRIAAGMILLIIPLAFLVGGLLNHLLLWIGWIP